MLPEIVLATSLLAQTTGWVRINRSFVCGPFAEIVQGLASEEFKESPAWIGNSGETRMVLFLNSEKNSWTVVHYTGNTGCVVGAGESSTWRAEPSKPQKPAVHDLH